MAANEDKYGAYYDDNSKCLDFIYVTSICTLKELDGSTLRSRSICRCMIRSARYDTKS